MKKTYNLLQGGFRLSLGEDGRMIVHQPQITTNTLTQVIFLYCN